MTEPTDRLRRYGEDLASAVSPARSRVAAMRAIGRASEAPPRRLMPRIAFATLGVLVVTNVVAAGVADAAVPGDALYGLDRGYEKVADLVGLGGDRSNERIAEAEVLVERDDLEGAAALVAEAVGGDSVRDAVAELRDADPSDPRVPEFVHALVSSAHDLVDARQGGESNRIAEARAAVDLAALQIAETPAGTRPPDHARNDETPGQEQRQGPPDGARNDEAPGQDRQPGPPGEDPANEAPGRDGTTPDRGNGPPEEPGPPGSSPPSQGPPDEPGSSGSPGPPASTPGGPSGGDGPQGPPEQPPGQSGSQGPQSTSQGAPSGSQGSPDEPPGRSRGGGE